ncbi:hypothetical protein, partial [Escherichia coli]|uniref:hypothetical protein n=1 Tax=Escherichia coli TaxID=562 RepID=UPI001CC6E4EE
LFIVGSLIFSIGAPIAAFWEKRYREDREVSLESEIERNVTEQRVALEDSISPLVDAIGQAIVTAPGERSSTGSRLIQQGINAIRSIIGRDG